MPTYEITFNLTTQTKEESEEVYNELWEYCCEHYNVNSASMKWVKE